MEDENTKDDAADLERAASMPLTYYEPNPEPNPGVTPEGSRTVLTDVGQTPVVIPSMYLQPRPMKVAIYQCLNQRCRSKTDPKMMSYDRLRLFPAEGVPAIIDCQNCGGGRGIPTQKEMYQQQKGMTLVGTYMIDMNDDENTPGLPVTQAMVDRAKVGH